MAKQRIEKVALHCAKHSVMPDENDSRIIDRYRHFLGKISEGRLYVYCVRCKTLIPTRISIKK